MKPCQWPDDSGEECGEPPARRMWQYGAKDAGRRDEFYFCQPHLNAKRQKLVEAARWYVDKVPA